VYYRAVGEHQFKGSDDMLVLEKLYPCKAGLEFYKTQKDIFDAWNNCPRGDWLLWLANKINIDHKLLTLAKGKCAETVVHLMKDDRSKAAVKAAIDYGNGLVSLDFLHTAADAAEAAYAAYAACADSVAYSADAADAAYDAHAAYVSCDAAYASYAAYVAYAACSACDADVLTKNRLNSANIFREILTAAVFEKINNYK
jgi:hypothetical protein